MKISVLVVAHNEERHIATCIESLLAQSTKADEIVLVAHNCTDQTAEIGRKYPIRVVEHAGPSGAAYARIRGFEEVTGDIVLCIDGDAVAAPNWVAVLSELLTKPGTVMVGSWIKMAGSWYEALGAYRWYFFYNTRGPRAADWLWGASLGFWTKDRSAIIAALTESVAESKNLGLAVNPDDFWLALSLKRVGVLEVTNRTWVTAYSKETSFFGWLIRNVRAQYVVRRAVLRFFKEKERAIVPVH